MDIGGIINGGGCPGGDWRNSDRRNWTPDDVFEEPCPECGEPIEFFRDDRERRCSACGSVVANPRAAGGSAH